MSRRLILADEPTGNLDSKMSVEVFSLFQKLNDEGITIVLGYTRERFCKICKKNC